MAAVYENIEGGISYLDKIAVYDGRAVIPFGAQLRMIVGIYRPEDRDHVANLLSPGAAVDLNAGRVTNLALPEDATVLVECEVAAQFASYGSNHCRLPIPSYVAKNTILALVPKSESAPEIYNDEWLRREDLLRYGRAIDGSVLTFGQILDQGARVQLVTGDVSGRREALSLNEDLIEIVDKDGDRSMSRYRVVTFKRVRVSKADTLDILSEPTTLL